MSTKLIHFTRLAPTPSGYLHLGNIASFVFTVALARKLGAKVRLRIDDGDAERTRDEYLDDIFLSLHYLGIGWDEGPADSTDFKQNHSQQLRLPLYQSALQRLADSQHLFACNCSRSLLNQYPTEKGYPGFCLKKPLSLEAEQVAWRLSALPADTQSLPESMRHFIVRKKDGLPAYQLCSLIDDLHYGTDLIVRGEDLLESTAAQLFLADLLGERRFAEAQFVHHPLLTDAAGQKLSKSAGAVSIKSFRDQGAPPAAVFKAIAGAYGLSGEPENQESLAALLMERWLV